MYFARISAGRFLELRIELPFESADLKPFQALVGGLVRHSPRPIVACADLRSAPVFTQDVVAGIIELMRSDNANLERTALLVASNAVSTMQIERILRSAENPNRRAFRNPKDAWSWLCDVLDAEERRQLHRFIWSSRSGQFEQQDGKIEKKDP